ncbi:NAD-dependent epimerase [Halalkalibaculum sp. DA384]|uniref:NAD-dependent epimerase n=1 Tax=Halalkalibaculum sp. DA384 TaxID=3373606 RepID=UPI0037540C5E
MIILVTGAAGFIGFHLSKRLLQEGHQVVGIDDLNDYYSVDLKTDRVEELKDTSSEFSFVKADISDIDKIEEVFQEHNISRIYHLAAQAGVRYSINNPDVYIRSNLIGFYNIIEAARQHDIEHLIFASSSSVYGANKKVPYEVSDHTDHPVSLYAATKKSNEMLAHSYSHLYDIPMTGLRFFTVYGPWGRPDMAYFKFTDLIKSGQQIEIYNEGDMYRDFTYVDDIVEALYRILNVIPEPSNQWDAENPSPEVGPAPYRLYNIGNNTPIKLMDFVNILEEALGVEANKVFKPMQPGDVYRTWADCEDLYNTIEYKPETDLEEGIGAFVDWYEKYYN